MLNFAYGVPSRAERGCAARCGRCSVDDADMAEATISAARGAFAGFDLDADLIDVQALPVPKPAAVGQRWRGALISPIGRRRFLLVLLALATGLLLELAAGIVDLRAQELRAPCLKSDAVVDGKGRQPTPALIAAREMAPACRGWARSGVTADEVQLALDRLSASLATLSALNRQSGGWQ
jgi:hypothetical protein